MIDVVRVLLSVAMLGYASWSDLRTREVADRLWLAFGSLGLTIDLYGVVKGPMNPLSMTIPILIATALSFILGYIGLFGGADFKAFVVLALLTPYAPLIVFPILGVTSVVFPLTVFSNSALAGASIALVALIKNLVAARRGMQLFRNHESESAWKKFIILISGMKVNIDAVRGPPFQYPLECPTEGGIDRKLVLMPDVEDDEAATKTFQALRDAGVTEVWVSHTLPFLVFITFGFISSLLIGDIALWTLTHIIFR